MLSQNNFGNILLKSEMDTDFEPAFISEYNSKIFVHILSKGIFIYNNFGRLEHTIADSSLIDFHCSDNYLYILDSCGNASSFDLISYQKQMVKVPEASFLGYRFFEDHLIIFRKNGFTVYRKK